MKIIEKINKIKEIKENIKTSIENKGIDTTNKKFEEYPTLIDSIVTGSGSDDYEINNMSYLFFGDTRNDCLKEILKHCKDVIRIDNCFYNTSILNELDLTNVNINIKNISNNLINFDRCFGLTYFNKIKLPTLNLTEKNNFINMNGMCNGSKYLEEIVFPYNWNELGATNINSAFSGCTKLKKVQCNISYVSGTQYYINNCFKDCTSLEEIDFSGTTNVYLNFDVSTTALNREGLLNMLDTLPTLTKSITITIGTNKMNLLTEEDISNFTLKGYTLA